MFTFGFPFRPWTGDKSVASGASILGYVQETAAHFSIDKKIRFGVRVDAADFSKHTGLWTLQITKLGTKPRRQTITL